MNPKETLHVTPTLQVTSNPLPISPIHAGTGVSGLIGRGGFTYRRPLVHKPNTLHLTSASTCYAVLQSTHRLAVGAPPQEAIGITGVTTASVAADIYRKTRAAAVTFYVATPPAKRRALFQALLTFATQQKSFDGLEGLFLTGLRAQEEEGNTPLVQQAIAAWKGVGVGSSRDLGGQGSVFLDMESATLLTLSGDDLKALGTAWSGTGSAVFGSFNIPSSLKTPTASAPHGIAGGVPPPPPLPGSISPALPGAPGLPGGSGLPGGPGGLPGGVFKQAAKDAGNDFLGDLLGQQQASDIETAIQTVSRDAGEGAAVGGIAGPVGRVVGGIVGFIYGLFEAQSIIDGQHALDSLNTQLDALLQTLDDLIKTLNDSGASTSGDTNDGTPDPTAGDGGDGPPPDDTPDQPDPPDGGGDMAIGDAGDDNGSDTGSGANNVDINTNWPPLVPQGGGSSGDPGDGGDGVGKAHPLPPITKSGGGGFQVDDGPGSDTGLHQLPPGLVLTGGTGDHSGDLDGLGKVHPIPNPGGLATSSGATAIRKVSLTSLGGGALHVRTGKL